MRSGGIGTLGNCGRLPSKKRNLCHCHHGDYVMKGDTLWIDQTNNKTSLKHVAEAYSACVLAPGCGGGQPAESAVARWRDVAAAAGAGGRAQKPAVADPRPPGPQTSHRRSRGAAVRFLQAVC